MFKTLANVFKVPELRNKILFTLFLLAIYRVGFSVPLPGVDQELFVQLQQKQQQGDAGVAGRLASYVSIFSGGNINQSTIFGLGLMPYISASIIFQLAGTVIPSLEKMQKEGESGRRKIQEWTRYATVILGMVQGSFWLSYVQQQGLIAPYFATEAHTTFWIMGIVILTTSTLFLMWLGEQIDEYGLGNGVSLLIMAGILSQLPGAIAIVVNTFDPGTSADVSKISTADLLFLICSFIAVTGFAILHHAGTASDHDSASQIHTRPRKCTAVRSNFLPLRLNHGGVMPVIFAQSLMIFADHRL